jgi:hypothetical protein
VETFTVSPELVHPIVYRVETKGDTTIDPEIGKESVVVPVRTQIVAFVLVHLIIADWPAVMLVGFAETVTADAAVWFTGNVRFVTATGT